MSTVGARSSHPFAPQKPKPKPLPRIIVARGEKFLRGFTFRAPGSRHRYVGRRCILGAIYLIATAYMFFHDDLLTAAIARRGRT